MNRSFDAKPESRRFLLTLPLVGFLLYTLGRVKRPTFNVKEVGLEEGKALIAAGAVIVDVRDKEFFDVRHIPNAMLLPLAILRVGVPAAFAYAKEKAILVYCGDGVTHGPEGTQLLNNAGFPHAVNLKPGIHGWFDAGLPVKAGTAP